MVKYIKVKQKQNDRAKQYMRAVGVENKPNLNADFGWCVFKYMFIALVFTNLLWAAIHFSYVYKSFSGTSMEVLQDGTNNNQSVTNG